MSLVWTAEAVPAEAAPERARGRRRAARALAVLLLAGVVAGLMVGSASAQLTNPCDSSQSRYLRVSGDNSSGCYTLVRLDPSSSHDVRVRPMPATISTPIPVVESPVPAPSTTAVAAIEVRAIDKDLLALAGIVAAILVMGTVASTCALVRR